MATTGRPVGATPIDRRSLVVYTAVIAVGSLATQAVVALVDGSGIGVLGAVPLALLALYAVWFCVAHRARLRMRAFADLYAHGVLYLLVNLGFWMHAGILTLAGNGPMLDDGWFPAAVVMPALWGIGLVLHVVGSYLDRGFDVDL